MKKFVSFLFLIFFCSNLGADSKELPSLGVLQVPRALFKVKSIFSDLNPNHGTGFAVRSKDGRKFVVTNRHIVQEDKDLDNLSDLKGLETEAAQSIELTHWYTKQRFIVKKPVRFSVYADLVLMEVPDYTGPVIKIARFNRKRNRQESYMMGFSSESQLFYRMTAWGVVSQSKNFLIGMNYAPLQRGASGSPLLDRNGRLIGVLYGSGGVFATEKYFVTSHQVQKLLDSVKDRQENPLSNQLYEEVTAIKTSAEAGDTEAQFLLSHLYSKEHFNHPEESLKWEREAAENGDLMALIFLAGDYRDEGNYEKEVSFLEQAAEKGSAGAAFRLGKMYVTGLPIPQDLEKGWFRLRQAVAGEYPLALLMLGGILTGHNRHVPLSKVSGWRSLIGRFFSSDKPPSNQDISEGQKLLRLLADRGFSRNLHNVRRMLNVLEEKGYSHDVSGGVKLLFYLGGDHSQEGYLFQDLEFLYNLEQQGFVPTVSSGLEFLDVLEQQGLSQEKREETIVEYMFFSMTSIIQCRPELFSPK